MPRTSVMLALLLLPACDAAVNAQAQAEPVSQPLAGAEANVAVVDVDADVAVDTKAAAAGQIELSADAFKLGEVTTLVQSGTIETAAELELAINDPEEDFNRVDIDVDGKIDHIEVVEVRNDARVDFELRVIPSSKPVETHAVHLATASVVADAAASQVSYSASFSANVHFSAGASAQAEVYSFVEPARFEASAVVVGMPLLAWAFIDARPVYHSIYIEPGSRRWIPPGHLKHGHWKARGGVNPGGHGGFDGHGGGKGGKGGGKGHGSFDLDGHGKGGGKGHGSFDRDDHGKGGASKGSGPAGKGGSPRHESKPQPSKSSSGGGGGSSKGGGGSSSKGGGGGSSSKGGGGGSSSKGGGGGGGGGKGGKGK